MPGKYSHLKGTLTKFSGEPEYQERVNRKKDEIKQQIKDEGQIVSASTLGLVLVKARLEKERLEDLVKSQNLIIEAMQQELVDLLESQDFTSLKLGNGVSISIKDDVYCTVKDKQKFNSWVRETEQEDLFTVNYQTMSSLVKQKLIEGEDIPPGIDTYFKQSIMVRGGKNVEVE